MTTTGPVRSTRGRRSTRPSGDDRELAILTTAERLLEERSYADISVDDLAKGAGLSRPTFYFYFASKDAVLTALIDRVIGEADRSADAALGGRDDAGVDPAGVWRSISALFATFGAHRAVTLAGATARASVPEIAARWSTFMEKWIDYTTESIESERARGAAPNTVPARDLAISLNLMNERTMFAAFADEPSAVPADRTVDTLAHIWVSSIYGAGH
ncbi:HTH-type transcriptional regulator EthR [Mycobacterium kubicae]|uniref:HTH-type transcriptional regulator EthR n=1 Tax=Mycobacterium kubicae TaxID=120959 RepID=A0AAX1J3W2_9MYCO|nr:TetR/AcrR family transcriptional regulator [Mycobacterium kubicae]MCV7097464.1 TetR/AcrR family transcriptional regulator [Mycobacterium kubicae]OBF21457.1 TetR family transcriptional regulator [Mycobacterium kubicae]OBK49154.1 TetR family transcriptional regulator [Mycobacterium kubicae]ORV96489.1 TetR family transcriptional regulator [Mycobacterium kubicae]QNI12648.1 TetR/AcrR family transcriptional regulator [Mycobacterium kubicae]